MFGGPILQALIGYAACLVPAFALFSSHRLRGLSLSFSQDLATGRVYASSSITKGGLYSQSASASTFSDLEHSDPPCLPGLIDHAHTGGKFSTTALVCAIS